MAKGLTGRRLLLLFLISILLIGNIDISVAAEEQEFVWKVIGGEKLSSSASRGTSVFVYDGVPYVAYRDFENYGKLTVKKFVDGDWEMVGSAFSPAEGVEYSRNDISMFIENGIIYVAYCDWNNKYMLTVSKYENGGWEHLEVEEYSTDDDFEIRVNNGEIYLANGGSTITVRKYEGEGFWSKLASHYNGRWSSEQNISIQIYGGDLYVAYTDWKDGGKAVVKRCVDGNLESVGGAVSDDIGYWTSLNIENGAFYLAYQDGEWGKSTVKKYNGESWELVGERNFSDGMGRYMSSGIDGGVLYVSYPGVVKKFDGNGWVDVARNKISTSYTSIHVYEGQPFISYSGAGVMTLNGVPKALEGNMEVQEDEIKSGILKGTDVDGDGLTYSVSSQGAKGTVEITDSSTGAYKYLPKDNETGSDSFTFKVNDGTLDSEIATVSVTITNVNDKPVAKGGELSVTEEVEKTGMLLGSDIDSESLTYEIVKQGTKGTVEISDASTGAYKYHPKDNETGSDSFTFKVNDGTLDSEEATVYVSITNVNDKPVAEGGELSVTEEIEKTGMLLGSDIDSESLTYEIVKQGTKGTVEISDASTGAYKYHPKDNETGSDSFTFKVNDGTLDSEEATVYVSITNVNDKPVAKGGELSVTEEIEKTGMLSGEDIDSESLTYEIVKQGTKGLVEISDPKTGAYKYHPKDNETGSDSFTFKVNDGTLDSEIATVYVSITNVNDKPVAKGGELSVTEEIEKTGMLLGEDIDSESLTYEIVKQGTKGLVEISDPKTGAYKYHPKDNETGPDSFTFKVNDGEVDSEIATVYVSITNVNDKPVARGGELSVTEEIEKTGMLSGEDIDSESLTYEIVKQGTKGTVEISDASTGAYKYLPKDNETGSDSFTFKVNDGTLDSEEATVYVSITNVNDKPVAKGGELSVTEEVEKTGTLSGSDIDSESLTYEIVKQGTKGLVEISDPKTGAYKYIPKDNETGSDSFTFKVNDGTLDSEEATVYVSITNVNDKPAIKVESPYEDKILRDDEIFTLKGMVGDLDNDKVSVTATVYGSRKYQKSISVDTKIEDAWSLSWNTKELEEGEYKDIIIVADDGNEGKGESIWKHTLKIDKKNPDLPELTLENKDGAAYKQGTWTNENIDFAIKISDEIDRCEYKIGDSGWQNGQSGEIEKEGETRFYYRVWDKAGNSSEEESATINIDRMNPDKSEISINTGDKYSNDEFVTLKLYSKDEMSGMAKMMISNNKNFAGAFWEEYKETKSWTLDDYEGKNTVYAKFMDQAGNITEKTSDDIVLDTIAPKAEIETDNDGYTNKSIIMTLTAYDKDGSGLDRIKLPNNETIISMTTYKTVRESVYGSVYQTVYDKLHSGGPIAGGGYQLRYIAVENGEYNFIVEDNADNKKKITQTIGEIDASKPTGVIIKSSEDWTNEGVNLTISAIDNGDSGIKGIRLPDGNFKKSAAAEYSAMENGTYEFIVENNAGSRGRVSVKIDNIDKDAPSKPKISRLPDADYNYGSYKIDMIEGNDGLSGVERSMYRLSGAENSDWTEYDGGFEVQEIGITLIQAKTIDKAGNESEAKTMNVEVKRRKHSSSDDKDQNDQIIKEPIVVEDDIVELVEGGIDAVIELDAGKHGGLVLDGSVMETLAENKKPLTIKSEGIKLEFDVRLFEAEDMQDAIGEEESKIEISAIALSHEQKDEIIEKSSMDDSGLHDMQSEIFDVSTKISSKEEDRMIKDFHEPVAISIDLSGVELGEEEIGKLTGIRFEENEDGSVVPVKLGGVYDEDKKTFTFYTDQADKVSVVKADELFEMDLTIDSRKGLVNHEVKMNDVEPKIIDDRTMVPVRFIAENLGGKVNWIEESQTIEIGYKGKTLEMTIDQPIEGFDAKPVIMNDRALVPLRYVSENLEAEVLWFPSDRKVKIVK